jgi:hypothetical protein
MSLMCSRASMSVDGCPDAFERRDGTHGERQDPAVAEADADGRLDDLLVERLVAGCEFGGLHRRERVLRELLGLGAGVVDNVLDRQRVDAERLGGVCERPGVAGHTHPRRPFGLARRGQVAEPPDARPRRVGDGGDVAVVVSYVAPPPRRGLRPRR